MPTKTIAINGTPLLREAIDGISRYSINVLEALSRLHPEWRFLILSFRNEAAFRFKFSACPNVETFILPIDRRSYKLLSVGGTINVDRFVPEPIDVFVSSDFVLQPSVKSAKKLVVIHDLAFRDMPDTVATRNRRFLEQGVARSLSRTDAVACVSKFTQERLQYYYSDKLTGKELLIAPNGVDQRFLTDIDQEPVQRLRKRYGLPDRFLLSVGTNEPRKNLSYLLEAFGRLTSEQQQNCPLVLVGKAGWGEQAGSGSSHVMFTGYVEDEDLPALYHLADAFVFSSMYEGFGIPVLEAMAAGTSVITTRIPSVEEFAADSVVYAPLGDPDHFAQALLMRSSTEQREKARSIARQYSWDNAVIELEKWIEMQLVESADRKGPSNG